MGHGYHDIMMAGTIGAAEKLPCARANIQLGCYRYTRHCYEYRETRQSREAKVHGVLIYGKACMLQGMSRGVVEQP